MVFFLINSEEHSGKYKNGTSTGYGSQNKREPNGEEEMKPIIPNVIFSNKASLGLFIVVLPVLILVLLAFFINCKNTSRSRTYIPLDNLRGWIRSYKIPINDAKLNLGRLLVDPKMSGFNRVALDDSDNEPDSQSDSEVEEFNINSVKRI